MKRILTLLAVAAVLFGIAGHLEAVNVPAPPTPAQTVGPTPVAFGPMETVRLGCYANLYNRRGAYAVCTTKGTVFRSWSVCSDGKTYYGPWIRSTGYNQSGVWCRTPYHVVKQGYQRSAT